MAVYTSTGYNDHYMYLNQGQQTIPNGLVRTWEGRARPPRGDALTPTCPGTLRPASGQPYALSSFCPSLRVVMQ